MSIKSEVTDIKNRKQQMRQSIEAAKKEFFTIPQRRESEADFLLPQLLRLNQWQQAPGILCYLSMDDEFPTERIIQIARGAGKPVALPRLTGKGRMDFYLWDGNPESLEPHPYGMLEPSAHPQNLVQGYFSEVLGDSNAPAHHPWICITPGLAFDSKCRRLGRGGGFYDHYIFRMRRDYPGSIYFLGVGLSFQHRRVVPTEATDQTVDGLLIPSS
jgi:5-formyltetrahydrofolate cyclo-ligase